MGGICKRKNLSESEKFNYYHCKKCGEIPLIDFSFYDFNISCTNHKIFNISIDRFYDYITLDYKCDICKKNSKNSNFAYCYDCELIYCKTCLNRHNINNSHYISNNIIDKNIICKLHNKNYTKFCMKCKLNLCEQCENSYNHYTELFSDIYPLNEDIKNFKDMSLKILKNNIEENEIINDQENEDFISNNELENECIKIKNLFVDSFSHKISNYNYINNINNIIRTTFIKDLNIKYIKNEVKYIQNKTKYDTNNIENKTLIKSISKHNTYDFNSQTCCMKKLNDVSINSLKKLELVAIGGSNSIILILNLLNFNIYQIINEHNSAVYSLEQFKDNPNYLFSSSGDRTINIYELNDNFKYQLIQKLKKSSKKKSGEINKIIMLSNNLLISGDYTCITIWKSKSINKNEIYYEILSEIFINRDTSNLIEVNQKYFVAVQFSHGGHFQVYQNDGKSFPLVRELVNIESLANSSNGLAKIDDNLICSATNNNIFYIISIDPLQIIQKINICPKNHIEILYIYVTEDNYLYCKGGYQSIIQYKIIKDEDNNFVELKEIGIFNKDIHVISYERAILPFDDGRIFFVDETIGQERYNLIS